MSLFIDSIVGATRLSMVAYDKKKFIIAKLKMWEWCTINGKIVGTVTGAF